MFVHIFYVAFMLHYVRFLTVEFGTAYFDFFLTRCMFAMFLGFSWLKCSFSEPWGQHQRVKIHCSCLKSCLPEKLEKHCLQYFGSTFILCIEHANWSIQAASCRGGAKECAPRGHKVPRHLWFIPFLIFLVARTCPPVVWVEVSCWCRWRVGASHFGPSGGCCVGLKQFGMACNKDAITHSAPVVFVNLRGRRPVAH